MSSKKIRTNTRLKVSTKDLSGRSSVRKSLSQVAQEQCTAMKKRTLGLHAMTADTRAAISAMVQGHGAAPDEVTWGAYSGTTAEEDAWMEVDEDEGPVDTSHEGGEYGDSVNVLISEMTSARRPHGLHAGARTRRDRLQSLRHNWKEQMTQLVDAFMKWRHPQAAPSKSKAPDSQSSAPTETIDSTSVTIAEGADDTMQEDTRYFDVTAIKTHDRHRIAVVQLPGEPANVSLIRIGFLGCSPIDPSFALSLDTLEFYHRLRRRHPRLGVQAMTRALCDVHEVNYLDSYREQFSIAFDAYLDILRRVKQQVDIALKRDTPNWRIKNACPCCNYKLEDEPRLCPSRLGSMDGNNSAKRVASAGLVDSAEFESDYLLPREDVDRFKDEVPGRKRKSTPAHEHNRSVNSDSDSEDESVHDAPWVPDSSTPGDVTDGQETVSSCTENWKASAEEHKKKALDIYHQTGIFGSACRHHIIETFCEMIRSGELAKYPLAITNHALNVHSDNDMTIGYDIGCAFTGTAARSSLGPRVQARRLKFVVNAFHGYAHNRLCQTMHHIQYQPGCGIEDLETMERVFSASNNVARTIRYASQFHWAQALDLHFRQWDEEKYHELSRFLYNNYRQALEIISNYTPEVERMKAVLDVTDGDIEGWLEEERHFLQNLKSEPEERVLEISYVEALIARDKADAVLQQAADRFRLEYPSVTAADRAANESQTRHLETSRRNALHAMTAAIQAVNDLELKLDLQETWTPHHPQYQETLRYMRTRRFHRALDEIQRLVVQRLLEMTKANASGMSYKLRTSIGKALKTRSKAIRSALKKYNALAPQMDPPAPVLQWKDIMNYAFVSEFDLLHHTYSHKDISQRPWAVQVNREVAAKFYKIRAARDEIVRLNVECRRLQTHIRDEELHYIRVERELATTSPLLAAEVRKEYENRRRVNHIHRVRLNAIHSLAGFSGWTEPGTRMDGQIEQQDRVPGADQHGVQPAENAAPQQQNGPMRRSLPDPFEAQMQATVDEEAERAAVAAAMDGEDIDEVAEDDHMNEEVGIINDFVEQLAIEPVQMRRGVPVHMTNRFRI